jgi:hypothetical protein
VTLIFNTAAYCLQRSKSKKYLFVDLEEAANVSKAVLDPLQDRIPLPLK